VLHEKFISPPLSQRARECKLNLCWHLLAAAAASSLLFERREFEMLSIHEKFHYLSLQHQQQQEESEESK
jgi:hypothetical protein